MKKLLKLSVIAIAAAGLASTVTLAQAASYKGESYKGETFSCPVEKGLKDGFYVGAQVGYDSYRVRQNMSLNGANAGSSSNPVLNPTGFVGGLFAGYGQMVNTSFYLGGEVFINDSNASTNYSSTVAANYNAKFNVNGSAGLAVLPGLKINNTTLGYLRLGYTWARLQGQESSTSVSASKNNTSGGFAYGLGMETLIVDNWSVRGEYSHTNYNSFSTSMGSSFNPSDNQYMLGLVYHIA